MLGLFFLLSFLWMISLYIILSFCLSGLFHIVRSSPFERDFPLSSFGLILRLTFIPASHLPLRGQSGPVSQARRSGASLWMTANLNHKHTSVSFQGFPKAVDLVDVLPFCWKENEKKIYIYKHDVNKREKEIEKKIYLF